MDLPESIILDLFAGCGALGLESISRGAEKAYLVDSSSKAMKIIKQNITKTRTEENVVVLQDDYLKALEKLKKDNIQFDFVFLDPPYKTDYATKATDFIMDNKLINDTGKIIIETDIEEDVLEKLKNISTVDIYDVKKYGRVTLIFVRRKG